MSQPSDVAAEIRASWSGTGLQVEGVSHEGDGVRVKLRLPQELDVTDFSAAMFDLGATVMYKNDVVGGPTLLVTATTTDDRRSDDTGSDDESTDAHTTKKADNPTTLHAPRRISRKSYVHTACWAVSLLRGISEIVLVLLLAVYFSGYADDMIGGANESNSSA